MSELDVICFLFAFQSLRVILYHISCALGILTAASHGSLGMALSKCGFMSILEIFQRLQILDVWTKGSQPVYLCVPVPAR